MFFHIFILLVITFICYHFVLYLQGPPHSIGLYYRSVKFKNKWNHYHDTGDLAAFRESVAASRSIDNTNDGYVIKFNIKNTPVRIVLPEKTLKETKKLLIYIHGGGWVFNNVDIYEAFLKKMARETDMAILGIDYRKAPEHPYPAAFDDCLKVVNFLLHKEALPKSLENQPALQKVFKFIDTNQMIIGGDSAGGNLASAITTYLRDNPPKHDKGIYAQFLIYPALHYITRNITAFPSYVNPGSSCYFVDQYNGQDMWNAYAGPNQKKLLAHPDPYFEPWMVKSVKGLPPTLMLLATFDPLASEGREYLQRLKDASIPTKLIEKPTYHGFARNYKGQDINRALQQFCQEHDPTTKH